MLQNCLPSARMHESNARHCVDGCVSDALLNAAMQNVVEKYCIDVK